MNIVSYSNRIDEAAELLQEADYILIGAGAGLSAAVGLNYGDPKIFKQWFPELAQRGITTIGEAIGLYWNVDDSNRRAFWAYWANHIHNIRYQASAGLAYLDLWKIVKDKEHFIITTNVDGQFVKAGFALEKIFAPQGDYALFQCDKPCSDAVFDNKATIEQMISNMDTENFLIQETDIPKCPNCGSYLAKNLRVDHTFVEAPHILKQEDYIDFIDKATKGNLVMLELGVGFNTPGIIRWPFEQIASRNLNTTLIRMNMDYPDMPKTIGIRGLCFDEDIANVIGDIKEALIK